VARPAVRGGGEGGGRRGADGREGALEGVPDWCGVVCACRSIRPLNATEEAKATRMLHLGGTQQAKAHLQLPLPLAPCPPGKAAPTPPATRHCVDMDR
jgi:hypothetical protein